MTFGQALARGKNNLDLLRLCAALLVLFSHSFVLTGSAEDEPVALLLRHFTDGGGLAVSAFFVLSGFLVAGSAARHGWRRFVLSRVARIYPAYLAVVVFQVFVVGAMMTRLPLGTYLSDGAVWRALLRAVPFSPAAGLPGVFLDNPLPLVVNGSLWTLRVEAACYVGIGVVAWLGGLRPAWVLAALAAGFGLRGGVTGLGAPVEVIVGYGLHFCAGAAFWCGRDHVRLRALGVGLCALFIGVSLGTEFATFIWHLMFPYAVLAVGLSGTVAAGPMRRLGDVSYGTYLFAFPVQQCLVTWFAPGPWALAAMAVPPVLALAVLSRRFIEVPCLVWARPSPALPGLLGAARNSGDRA